MAIDKIGRIIWHDLFTTDLQRSMTFYQQVAGWSYKTEHATDFTWGGGEKDFVLALLDEEAGAGFTETPPALTDGWIAYVEVQDVDATTALAEKLGATIIRSPFEVPGVGRNALLRDPAGALFGISLSRHSFPAPQRQFDIEVYMSNTENFPNQFYTQIFDWEIGSSAEAQHGRRVTGPSGDDVAVIITGETPLGSQPVWMPSLKVTHQDTALKKAKALGAELFTQRTAEPAQQHGTFLHDPCGALTCLATV